MKRKQTSYFFSANALLKLVLALATLSFTSSALAWWQQTPASVSSAYECTQVALEPIDPSLLTKEERIALLDDALSTSIDSFSSCVSSAAQTMSGGGSGQGGSGQGGGGGQGGDQGEAGNANNGQNSGNTMVGNLPAENATSQNLSFENEGMAIPSISPIPDTSMGKGSTPAPRGIIAPKDNDKIICKLLFQEISKTTDPDMLAGLTQQYKNYQCG